MGLVHIMHFQRKHSGDSESPKTVAPQSHPSNFDNDRLKNLKKKYPQTDRRMERYEKYIMRFSFAAAQK